MARACRAPPRCPGAGGGQASRGQSVRWYLSHWGFCVMNFVLPLEDGACEELGRTALPRLRHSLHGAFWAIVAASFYAPPDLFPRAAWWLDLVGPYVHA